jgi:hypothetical protein
MVIARVITLGMKINRGMLRFVSDFSAISFFSSLKGVRGQLVRPAEPL